MGLFAGESPENARLVQRLLSCSSFPVRNRLYAGSISSVCRRTVTAGFPIENGKDAGSNRGHVSPAPVRCCAFDAPCQKPVQKSRVEMAGLELRIVQNSA